LVVAKIIRVQMLSYRAKKKEEKERKNDIVQTVSLGILIKCGTDQT
jgi:hypothetical protein